MGLTKTCGNAIIKGDIFNDHYRKQTALFGLFFAYKKRAVQKMRFFRKSYTSDNIALPCGSILKGDFLLGNVIGKGGRR